MSLLCPELPGLSWVKTTSFSHLQSPTAPATPPSLFHVVSSHRLRYLCISESESCSVLSDSLQSHGLYSPWNSPSQNTRVGSLSLFQGIFPTQGLNPGLPHFGQILYQLSHKGSPILFLVTLLLQYGLAFSGTHQACPVFEPLLGSILQIHFSITSSGTLLLITLSKVLSETACFFSPSSKCSHPWHSVDI